MRRCITTEPPLSDDGFAQDAEQGIEESGPLRRCMVTRERLAKERMIRFVVGPDRAVVPDLAGRLPGRGMWLSARRDVVELARTKGAFARAARGAVTVPPDLPAELAAALERRIVDQLGLARRAGQAVCGYTKVREWLEAGRASVIVHARDGSADEARRLLGARQAAVVRPLDAARLGAVFGRDHAVHVALAPGRLAESVATESERLRGIRDEPDPRTGASA